MILRTFSLAIAAATATGYAAAAMASPPMSRVEQVLDLSTPEAAVQTYSEVFAEDDFIAAYFALDPTARMRFMMHVQRFQFDDYLDPDADQDLKRQAFDAQFGPYEHPMDYERPFLGIDVFHSFQVILWSADQLGIHAIDFAGPVEVQSVDEITQGDGARQVVVHAVDTNEGPVAFLLRESPAGRWRVDSIVARPEMADEAFFLPQED